MLVSAPSPDPCMLMYLAGILIIWNMYIYIIMYLTHPYNSKVIHTYSYTVEPVYYGHLGTINKCVDYTKGLIFKCPDQWRSQP